VQTVLSDGIPKLYVSTNKQLQEILAELFIHGAASVAVNQLGSVITARRSAQLNFLVKWYESVGFGAPRQAYICVCLLTARARSSDRWQGGSRRQVERPNRPPTLIKRVSAINAKPRSASGGSMDGGGHSIGD